MTWTRCVPLCSSHWFFNLMLLLIDLVDLWTHLWIWFMDPPMNLHFPSHCGRPVCLWPCRALWPLVVVWGRSIRRSQCATYAEEMCSFCLLQVLIQSLVGDFLKCSVFKAFSLFHKLIKSVIKPLLTSRCCELKTGSSGNQLTSLLEPFQIYVLH